MDVSGPSQRPSGSAVVGADSVSEPSGSAVVGADSVSEPSDEQQQQVPEQVITSAAAVGVEAVVVATF